MNTIPSTLTRAVALLGIVALGCGPGSVVEDETWMLGTFSSGQMPCDYVGAIHRLHIHEDGQVELLRIEPSFTQSWTARWEQRQPGRIRIVRNEDDPGGNQYNPIQPGWEWEITRGSECELADGYNVVWHDIDAINLESGQRLDMGRMAQGELCPEYDRFNCGDFPAVLVTWCEGSEPPPDCAAQ
jgi:hypothetical protein